jgi:hypothetical protein
MIFASLDMAESQTRPDILTLYTTYPSITSYASNTLLCQSGIEAMFYAESVGESHLRDNRRLGRRSRQFELTISIRPICVEIVAYQGEIRSSSR